MSKIEKTLQKWKNAKQPARREEVIAVLERYFPGDFEHKKGSHIIVRHPLLKALPDHGPKGEFSISVRSGQKVIPHYLRMLARIIEYVEETKAGEQEARGHEEA